MDIKPSVFPTKQIANNEAIPNNESNFITNDDNPAYLKAVEDMKMLNDQQVKEQKEQGFFRYNIDKLDNKNKKENNNITKPNQKIMNTSKEPKNVGPNPDSINPYIIELSQPNFNSAFDVLPLPSEGKTYKNKKNNIKVSYLTTADENILSSPNLLESGRFLEILINRKMLEQDLRYNDLLMGDRDAIMIWLRATAYGEEYPVSLFDENDELFETTIKLNELNIKKLSVDPDDEGLFTFTMPTTSHIIKFKLLTCGDSEKIEKLLEFDKANNIPVNNSNSYILRHLIVDVNGNRDKTFIYEYVNNIRISDNKALFEYIEKLNCGVDMNIKVKTPSGSMIDAVLPLNVNFFWPNIRV
jgi:hypothetical protein